jgi:MoxR-like ATPase
MRNEDDSGVRPGSPSRPAIDCDTTYKIVDDSGAPEQYHRFDPESALAIRAALAARRPLLVRGEPGVGKTQLAAAAAVALGRPLVQKVVDSRTESRDLLWEFDSILRLADAQVAAHSEKDDPGPSGGGSQGRLPIAHYVKPGPLWWAFDWEGARSRAKLTGAPIPCLGEGVDPRNGCVVLIDEIDKGESDVPNGLLEALGSCRFTPLGQSDPVVVRGERPLVVITTNEERELPNAFVRRCLVLELKLPRDDRELIDHLVARAEVHFPERAGDSPDLFRKAAELVAVDRRAAREANLMPLPGQAEYLDLLRALFNLDLGSTERAEDMLEKVRRYAVRKFERVVP